MKLLLNLKNYMIFIWVPNNYFVDIMNIMSTFGYTYIESITWIKKNDCDHFFGKKSEIFIQCHENLLIFKNNKYYNPQKMNMKYQQNNDIVMEYVSYDTGFFLKKKIT